MGNVIIKRDDNVIAKTLAFYSSLEDNEHVIIYFCVNQGIESCYSFSICGGKELYSFCAKNK